MHRETKSCVYTDREMVSVCVQRERERERVYVCVCREIERGYAFREIERECVYVER